ncbi:hypothetical protein HZA96_01695 [Candidatus Woesearchaeota archaeon]|nr:hypothetical protein [Candidatus Woesearchaeota archaeon]
MHPKQQKRLSKKGWSKKEIQHSVNLLRNTSNKQKHKSMQRGLHHLGFYILLIVIIFGSFILSMYSIPILVLFNSYYIHWVVVVLGLLAGLFFTSIINEMNYLEKKHHFILLLALIIVILLNAIIMLGISHDISAQFSLVYDLDVVILLFGMAFLAPYLYTLIKIK